MFLLFRHSLPFKEPFSLFVWPRLKVFPLIITAAQMFVLECVCVCVQHVSPVSIG